MGEVIDITTRKPIEEPEAAEIEVVAHVGALSLLFPLTNGRERIEVWIDLANAEKLSRAIDGALVLARYLESDRGRRGVSSHCEWDGDDTV